MVLSDEEYEDFTSILFMFLTYAEDYLSEFGLESEGHVPGELREEELGDAIEAVWGTFGYLELIDTFVSDPSVEVDQRVKDVVASWRNAIYDDFTVFQDGSDKVFLYGDYAFSVCDLEEDLDSDLPCVLRTAIAPFGDHIVSIDTAPMYTDVEPATQDECMSRLRQARKRGKFIRMGQQLELVSAEAREEFEGSEANEERSLEEPVSLESDVTPLGGFPGRYVFDLVEAAEEAERRQSVATKEWKDLYEASVYMTDVALSCLSGCPAHTEIEALERHGTGTLEDKACEAGAKDLYDREDIIRFLLDAFPIDPQLNLRDLRLLGPDHVESVRAVVEAGGRLRVLRDDLAVPGNALKLTFPWVAFYHDGYGCDYVAAAPDDFVAALEGTDWDAEVERAHRLEQALAWLSVAVDFRGAIPRDECCLALRERYPDVDLGEVFDAIRRRAERHKIKIRFADRDGEDYLVRCDLNPFSVLAPPDVFVKHWPQTREGVEPYWPSEAEAACGACALFNEETKARPEVQELMRCLDAHDPVEVDNTNYADKCWCDIAHLYRRNGEDVRKTAEAVLADVSYSDQPDQFPDLLLAALRALPCRYLCGHSPASLGMTDEDAVTDEVAREGVDE